MSDVTVTAGNKTIMECDISPGNPKATFRWFKDAKEIYKSSHRYKMAYSSADHVASLVIHTAEASDSGRYKCEAANRMGRIETAAKLNVNGKIMTPLNNINLST